MTGWIIEAGYQYDVDRKEVATALAVAAQRLREDHECIYGLGCDQEAVRDYLDTKKSPCGLMIHHPDHEPPYVSLAASGGDPGRTKKEVIARSICITLMTDMHARGFNISVTCS